MKPKLLCALLAAICALAVQARAATYYVIVSGLGGEPDYEQRFTAAANELDKIFKAADPAARVYSLTGAHATAAQLIETLSMIARDAKADDDFGPDLPAAEIAAMCDRIAARRQLVVDTTSASGGAIQALIRPGRAVVAATKSGTEKNATVFARYWVDAFQDPSADTDKSDSISAMEAFTYAAKKTAEFYDSQKRLASFTLLRLGASRQAANDPAKRALLEQKDTLEQKIDSLKYQKAAMDPADYKKQLTDALVELAKVQGELDK